MNARKSYEGLDFTINNEKIEILNKARIWQDEN